MRRWAAARQASVRREACPPARRPRCELRSACRLEARPGPAGLAPPSDRATMTTGTATSIPTSFARRTPPDFRAAQAHVLLSVAALCAGGRRPAREIATREPSARNDRSRGPPWPCHRPPAPQPPSQRASLGASPRSPARPCRPRTTLRSGDHDHRHRRRNPAGLASPLPLAPPPTPATLDNGR